MDYILFHNFANGKREFGFYYDNDDAKQAYDDAVAAYKELDIAVEVGIAEIQKTRSFNWIE